MTSVDHGQYTLWSMQIMANAVYNNVLYGL